MLDFKLRGLSPLLILQWVAIWGSETILSCQYLWRLLNRISLTARLWNLAKLIFEWQISFFRVIIVVNIYLQPPLLVPLQQYRRFVYLHSLRLKVPFESLQSSTQRLRILRRFEKAHQLWRLLTAFFKRLLMVSKLTFLSDSILIDLRRLVVSLIKLI